MLWLWRQLCNLINKISTVAERVKEGNGKKCQKSSSKVFNQQSLPVIVSVSGTLILNKLAILAAVVHMKKVLSHLAKMQECGFGCFYFDIATSTASLLQSIWVWVYLIA